MIIGCHSNKSIISIYNIIDYDNRLIVPALIITIIFIITIITTITFIIIIIITIIIITIIIIIIIIIVLEQLTDPLKDSIIKSR